MDTAKTYLFVYGTLRSGMSSPVSHLIAGDILWKGGAMINASLYDIGGYPGAIPSNEENSMVSGEVMELATPEKIWKILDKYEGCDNNGVGSEYSRRKELVQLASGEVLEAWIYWYNLPVKDNRRIGSNDYLKYLQKKQLA